MGQSSRRHPERAQAERCRTTLAMPDDSDANGGGSLDIEQLGQLEDARALFDKGVSFGTEGRHEDAVAAYGELISRYGETTDPEFQELVAYALRNRGVRLGMLDRHREAIESYDQLVARFGQALDPDLREHVAAALLNKGVRLKKLRRTKRLWRSLTSF
jgi:tetratricopeptide (TPR) repeat protein